MKFTLGLLSFIAAGVTGTMLLLPLTFAFLACGAILLSAHFMENDNG